MYGALESIVVLWRLRSHRDIIIIIIIIIIIKCKDIVNLQGAEAYCVATRTACSVWTKNKQCSHRYATTSYVKPLQFNQQVPVTSRLLSSRARSALGVDTVLTLDVCMYVRALERKRLIGMT